jgi:hypothetical protein
MGNQQTPPDQIIDPRLSVIMGQTEESIQCCGWDDMEGVENVRNPGQQHVVCKRGNRRTTPMDRCHTDAPLIVIGKYATITEAPSMMPLLLYYTMHDVCYRLSLHVRLLNQDEG